MHFIPTPDLGAPPEPVRRRRWIRLSAAGLVGAIALGCWTAGAASAVPAAEISGDPHSPTVALLATQALAAHDTFSTVGTPAAFVAYVTDRNATADAVALEMSLDPVVLRDAWSRANLLHQEALLAALTQLGVAYRSNRSEPGVGFDCSGLTAFAWGRAGVQLSRQSGSQIQAAERRDQATAVAGDLAQYPGHVMLYLGVGDAIVHAANPASDVELSYVGRSVRFGDPS